MQTGQKLEPDQKESGPQAAGEAPEVLEEIVIEELSIDGICGVY